MKKLVFLAASAIAVMLANSCSVEQLKEQENIKNENLVHISLTAESIAETKSYLSDDLNVLWEATDEVAVYDGTAIRKFTITSCEGSTAKLEGSVADGTTEITAVYPYSLASVVDGKLALGSLESQRLSGKNVANGALLSMADTTTLGDVLQFKNQTSLLKLTVAEGDAITSFELQGLGGEAFYNEGKTLTLYPEGDSFAPGSYYMALAPTTFASGVRIIANQAEQRVCYAKLGSVEFVRNAGYDAGNVIEKGIVIPKTNTINTATELKTFLANALGVLPGETWTITADLDLTDVSLPSATDFYGILDGQNHTISNWNCNAPMFTLTAKGSEIKNINIASTCNINALDVSLFGILVGRMYGSMSGCSNAADITVTDNSGAQHIIGALVGRSEALMENCSNSGNITLTNSPTTQTKKTTYIGGIAGIMGSPQTGIRFNNCVNTGNVSVTQAGITGTASNMGHSYVGGILGSSAVNAGTETKTSGYTKNYGIIQNCRNEGNVSLKHPDGGSSFYGLTGGVVGYLEGSLESCINSGSVSFYNSMSLTNSKPTVGGIAGTLSGSAKNCTNSGAVYLEGMFTNGSDSWVTSAVGNIYAAVGGCIGSVGIDSDEIINCDNSGNVRTNTVMKDGASSSCVYGGILGFAGGVVAISNCDNTGTLNFISGSKTAHIGGIVAYVKSTGSPKISIDNCTCTGNITFSKSSQTAAISTGGILGYYDTGINITNSSFDGNITTTVDASSTAKVGGICGGNNGLLKNCSSNANITVKNAKAGSMVSLASAYYSGTEIDGTSVRGTITCDNMASGSFVGLFLGSTGSTSRTWKGATIDGTISGYSVAGYFGGRIAEGTIKLGTEAAPVIFKSTAKINDVAIAENPTLESLVPVLGTSAACALDCVQVQQ